MPMNWNAETDAKLFLGVLNQLKDTKLKLDYEKLVVFMGPECISGAVHNQIVRLRKKAETDIGGSGSAAADGEKSGEDEDTAGASAGAGGISDGSPQKRKTQRKPSGVGAAKKVKAEVKEEEEGAAY